MASTQAQTSRAPHRQAPVTVGLAGKATELATQALLITAVPRALGPSNYGALAFALAVVGVGSSLVTVGGAAVLGRYVPAAPLHERLPLAHALARRLALLATGQLVLAGTIAGVLVAVAPDRFPPLFTALVVVALTLEVVASLAAQVALGLARLGTWTFRYPLQNLVLVLAALLLARSGPNGAATAVAVSAAAGVVFAGLRVRDVLFAPKAPVPPRGAIRFGVLNALSSVLVLSTQRGAVLVAGLAAGTREAGFAGLAVGAGLTLTYAAAWLFTAQLPSLAERWAGYAGTVEAAARRLATTLVACYIPLTLLAALVGRFFLETVVGAHFGEASPALAPALAAAALAPLLGLAAQIATLRLRPEVRVVSAAAGMAAFIVTAVAAAPRYGAVGATAAVLAASVATLLVSARMLRDGVTTRSILVSFAGAAAVLAVGWS
jgi:O-antigen/teichoic acid export membrane protein